MASESRSRRASAQLVGTVMRPKAIARPHLRAERPEWLPLVLNATIVVAILAAVFNIGAGPPAMRAGQVAAETVVAQGRVTYPDHLATEAKRRQAISSVPVVYRLDTGPATRSRAQAVEFLRDVGTLLATSMPETAKQSAIRRLLPTGVSSAALHDFYILTSADFPVVAQRSLALLAQAVTQQFADNQLLTTQLALLGSIPSGMPAVERTSIGEVLSTFLTPTLVPDLPATRKKQDRAAARVPTQYSTIFPGQVVVRRGDLITPIAAEQLAALGLQGQAIDWRDIAASVLFAAIIVAMLFWYLHAFQTSIVNHPRLVLLVDFAILVGVIGARIVAGNHVLLPFMLPLAAMTTFAALLMAPEACVALGLAMAILAGWAVANSFELTIYYFVTTAAGVLAIRQIRQLKQFIVAGIYISTFALGVAVAFGLVNHSFDFTGFRDYVLAAGVNGFISSTLALGGFAMLSGYFGVTTTLQLFELAQPDQPLLRRLTSRAPGTYNHSLIVSNMVEQAAHAIGANAPVARVMALYHDVGKTANPHCFVENQLGIGNIHDELKPEESARIIRGHVAQGLKLARQFQLPRPILDAIAEHHGTGVLTFFLHKAQQAAGDDEPVNAAVFTYPGPKPQSKETALLMLADGCESAVRASSDHSPDGIRATVRRILQERIEQQQLDECPLTLRDLERTQAAFCSVLNGLYHPRIEYPDTTNELPIPTRAAT